MEIELITSVFNNYVRIKKIREVYIEISSNKFQSINVNEESVKNEVLKLNTKNWSTSVSIPATILKKSVEIMYLFWQKQ